jgi:outer membrane PBP1 activator LpoA protein
MRRIVIRFHRFFASSLSRALLYGALAACATNAAFSADAPAREAHVALLLPLNSASFGRHADAVRQGFAAAARVAGKNAPPLRIYPVNEDSLNVLTVYEQALESGARVVVGPLTRAGVAALAASTIVTLPTLALNSLEPGSPQPSRLYTFSLNVEQEARQIARFALGEGRRKAFVVADDTPLGRRMRQAFAQEFARRGGMIAAEYPFSSDPATLAKLRQASDLGVADMAFLAVDQAAAAVMRPYFGNSIALYATSRVHAGNATSPGDLNRVRFTDMPWLLQPDHAAVMVYPRGKFDDAIDFDRLYAFGIDAFRLGLELFKQARNPAIDGVTGRIRLAPDQQFVREPVLARFVDGKLNVIPSEEH